MNVTSSPPPAGGHSESGVFRRGAGSSTSARRLAALSLRGPCGESTWLTPACANSWASVSGASSIDGSRNGRSGAQAGENQRDRLGRLLRADPDGAVVGEPRRFELGVGVVSEPLELAVADRLAVPDQGRRIRLALDLVGEVVGEGSDRGLAHAEAPA